ncbi:hypothetical protein PG991_001825 [Apiospora marii]|uniref:Uncharacterized protein n=1 Tax=Apiospora marii TaxID=335849 RepID=A0ABR1SNH3_9PEZI
MPSPWPFTGTSLPVGSGLFARSGILARSGNLACSGLLRVIGFEGTGGALMVPDFGLPGGSGGALLGSALGPPPESSGGDPFPSHDLLCDRSGCSTHLYHMTNGLTRSSAALPVAKNFRREQSSLPDTLNVSSIRTPGESW